MNWFILSFLTAFSHSLRDVFIKKSVEKVDVYIVSWAKRAFALIFLLPLLPLIDIFDIGDKFWIALITGGILNTITTILYIKALKESDLSITVPMIAFTPLFLLITSPLIVGEFPNIFGLIGIFLIVCGSYTLNVDQRHKGYFAPFRALIKQKGPRLMLIVAFIWSIGSNIDKVGVLNSSPLFWVIGINIFTTITLSPIMIYKSRSSFSQIGKDFKILSVIALFSVLMLIFQMNALKLTLVSYVISIKRTSTIMSSIFGLLIFKEKGVRERLIGVMIMIFGVLFITLL